MHPVTHGDTYGEALKNAQEVLELMIDTFLEGDMPLLSGKSSINSGI